MSTGKPYVVYWNNIPSPYMVERFNAIADRGKFEFEAWFSDRLESGRSWDIDEASWRFRYRYVSTCNFGGRKFHWPQQIFGRRPDVMVSLYAKPSFLFGWFVAKLRKTLTAFWVEVTFSEWTKRTWFKETFKRFLFPRVDAIVTVGRDGKAFSESYGARSERIYFAPHVIDVNFFRDGALRENARREMTRKDLGLVGTTFVYVGRLWWGKGVNYLLEAFSQVQKRSKAEVSLLIVGDGPEDKNLREIVSGLGIRNVVFVGFRQKPELPRYYAAADVFVFPTLGDPYGLVVDEAMASSLPIVSTSEAGEIYGRVDDGINGYIVPPKNSEALALCMMQLVDQPERCSRMGKMSATKIEGHTPEKWADDFEVIVNALLAKARL